jgi:type IV secretory pathway protease TraF
MFLIKRLTECLVMLLMALVAMPAIAQCTRCGPAVSVNPTSLAFGAQKVGTRSLPKLITVRNLLPIAVRVGVGTTAPFQSIGCGGLLGGHKSCTINVTFAPLASGLATGATNITDGTPLGHFRVQLSGTGMR